MCVCACVRACVRACENLCEDTCIYIYYYHYEHVCIPYVTTLLFTPAFPSTCPPICPLIHSSHRSLLHPLRAPLPLLISPLIRPYPIHPMSIHTFRLPYHPLSRELTIISATQGNGNRYSYQLQLFCQLDTSLEARRQQQMAADVANPKPEESHGVKGLGAGLSLMAAAFNTNSLARYGNDVSTEWQKN